MSEYDKCLASAQKSLAMREHSSYQIKNKLANKGFNTETISNVVKELIDAGFQSDQRYLSEYIRYRQSQGHSKKKIIYELKSNGIDTELISENLSKFIDDYEILSNLALNKVNKQDLKDEKVIIKFMNHFKSRGFDNNIILKVINNMKNYEN
jgi:regulatory protein